MILNEDSDTGDKMTWALIDDQSTFHAKVVKAGNSAWGACVRMITWSAAQLSDGLIPAHIASLIANEGELKSLVGVGLLEPRVDGYYIHDYLYWNKSAEEVRTHKAKVSEARSKAGKHGGIASGKSRNNKQLGNEAKKQGLLGQNEALSSPLLSHPKEEKESTDFVKLIAHFHDAFLSSRGVKPDINVREGSACNRLLKKHGLDSAKSMISNAFSDSWYAKNMGTIEYVVNNPNKFLGNTRAINANAPRSFDPFPEGNE